MTTDHSSALIYKRTKWDRSKYLDQNVNVDDNEIDNNSIDQRSLEQPDLQRSSSLPDVSTSELKQINTIEKLTLDVLSKSLHDQSYQPFRCRQLSQELAGRIMEAIKRLGVRHYKYVVVVSIGSLTEHPGMHFGSRCLWDEVKDSFATVKYTNESLFAVAMLYGLYID